MDRLDTRQGNHRHDRAACSTTHDPSHVLVICTDPATLEPIAFALDDRREIQLQCIPVLDPTSRSAELESATLVLLDVESVPEIAPVLTLLESAGLPVIWLANEQNLGTLVRTLPIGAAAILTKPMNPESILAAVDTILRREVQARALAQKYYKMRQLVRRVVRERRDINRRVELICRDLVEAHRQLTYRFVELQRSRPASR